MHVAIVYLCRIYKCLFERGIWHNHGPWKIKPQTVLSRRDLIRLKKTEQLPDSFIMIIMITWIRFLCGKKSFGSLTIFVSSQFIPKAHCFYNSHFYRQLFFESRLKQKLPRRLIGKSCLRGCKKQLHSSAVHHKLSQQSVVQVCEVQTTTRRTFLSRTTLFPDQECRIRSQDWGSDKLRQIIQIWTHL